MKIKHATLMREKAREPKRTQKMKLIFKIGIAQLAIW